MIMYNHERRQAIMALLTTRRKLTIDEVLAEIESSPATLRRDFKAMEARGQVVRVHGGIIHPSAFRGEIPCDHRHPNAQSAKEEIAKVAASLIPANATVYIDAGTTLLELSRRLFTLEDITIYTNSITVATALNTQNMRVICIGGQVKVNSKAVVGGLADLWLKRLRFDIAFLGASGVSEAEGAYTSSIDEAHIKQIAMQRADKCVLLADSNKWGQCRTVLFADWSEFDDWVCDGKLDSAHAKAVSGKNVRVIQKDRVPNDETRKLLDAESIHS